MRLSPCKDLQHMKTVLETPGWHTEFHPTIMKAKVLNMLNKAFMFELKWKWGIRMYQLKQD